MTDGVTGGILLTSGPEHRDSQRWAERRESSRDSGPGPARPGRGP